MGGTRTITLLALLATVLLSHSAGAESIGEAVQQSTGVPAGGNGATAADDVNQERPTLFAEGSKASSNTLAVELGVSSTEIWEGVNGRSSSIRNLPTDIYVGSDPWTAGNSPVQNVDFLFTDVVGRGQQSAGLWFAKDRKVASARRAVAQWECGSNERIEYGDLARVGADLRQQSWSMDF